MQRAESQSGAEIRYRCRYRGTSKLTDEKGAVFNDDPRSYETQC